MSSIVGDILRLLVSYQNRGVHVDLLQILSAGDVNAAPDMKCFLDDSLACNWLTRLFIHRRNWDTNVWTSQKLFEGLSYISNNNIEELSLDCYGSYNLDYIKNFTKLNSLTITNSRVVDISGVEPMEGNNGIEVLSGLTNLEYVNLTNCSSLSQSRKVREFS